MPYQVQVASIIQDQIGHRALMMIGARELTATPNSLTFKVGRNAKGVTHVKVTLDPSDTYNVEAIRVHGRNVTPKAGRVDVYADQLQDVIGSLTGLYTSL